MRFLHGVLVVGQELFAARVSERDRVGHTTVVNWRRRHSDFPAPAGGTCAHPGFALRVVVVWLLAHDKIAIPKARRGRPRCSA